jgi:signal recognition particle subunit SRP54
MVEKVQATVDQAEAEALAQKLREDSFTLEDFAAQLRQVRNMGPLDQLVEMLPFGKGAALEGELDGSELTRFEAIISSMTPEERRNPQVINGSRRTRIARGSGTSVQDVNRLLKQHAQLRRMMKELKRMQGRGGRLRRVLPFLPR